MYSLLLPCIKGAQGAWILDLFHSLLTVRFY